MNEGIHLDLDTWIVPGQIRKAIVYIWGIKYITDTVYIWNGNNNYKNTFNYRIFILVLDSRCMKIE